MDCGDPVLLRKADLGRDMVILSSLPSGWHHHHQQSLLPPSSAEEEQPQDRGGGLLWEDFSVEDLLDLGAGGVGKEQHGAEGEGFLHTGEAEEEEEEKGGWCNSSTSSSTSALSFQAAVIPPSNSDPVVPVGSSPPSMARTSSCSAAEEKPNPCVSAGFETTQAGDVEDLEWVSRFVDDSYSEFASAALAPPFSNLHAPAPSAKAAAAEAEAPRARSTGSGCPLTRSWCSSCFSTGSVAVPARTRSKRSRTGGRFWSLRGPSLLSEPSSSSCSSASSSSSCSVFSSVTSSLGGGGGNPDGFPRCLGGGPFPNQSQLAQLQLTKKKKGRKPKVPPVAAAAAAVAGGSGGGAGQEARRRCSHCGVDKTPQWRAGPMGSKTLCNACGVRYKSGRLLPEYRPAGSPTFLSHVHSNSHRKVLEIRRSKELVAADGAAYCSASPPQHVVEATRPYGVV